MSTDDPTQGATGEGPDDTPPSPPPTPSERKVYPPCPPNPTDLSSRPTKYLPGTMPTTWQQPRKRRYYRKETDDE
jgi:hypothetical protein